MKQKQATQANPAGHAIRAVELPGKLKFGKNNGFQVATNNAFALFPHYQGVTHHSDAVGVGKHDRPFHGKAGLSRRFGGSCLAQLARRQRVQHVQHGIFSGTSQAGRGSLNWLRPPAA